MRQRLHQVRARCDDNVLNVLPFEGRPLETLVRLVEDRGRH
jgi:hypothetical protein